MYNSQSCRAAAHSACVTASPHIQVALEAPFLQSLGGSVVQGGPHSPGNSFLRFQAGGGGKRGKEGWSSCSPHSCSGTPICHLSLSLYPWLPLDYTCAHPFPHIQGQHLLTLASIPGQALRSVGWSCRCQSCTLRRQMGWRAQGLQGTQAGGRCSGISITT